ncbi:MAG TPA: Rieske (2Fe-2S) protein [Chthoniobacterales bacterium]
MSSPETPSDQPKSCACHGHGDAAPAAPAPFKPSRRDFLLAFGIGLNAIAGAMVGIPILGYALSAFARKFPLEWIDLGAVDKFPEGTTRLATYRNPHSTPWDGQTADIPCWVRRVSGNEFQVFAINCTHLGCPVRWFEESKLFMCPCHGGAFYEDGSHASGPPPRGLYTYEYRVQKGRLEIKGGVQFTLASKNV